MQHQQVMAATSPPFWFNLLFKLHHDASAWAGTSPPIWHVSMRRLHAAHIAGEQACSQVY